MIEALLAYALTAEGLAVIGFSTTLISEILALIPITKDNSITQLLAHFARAIGKKTKGDDRAKNLVKEIEYLKAQIEEVKKEGIIVDDPFRNLGRGR